MARGIQVLAFCSIALLVESALAGGGTNKIKCGRPAAAGGPITIWIDRSDPASTITVNIPANSSAVAKARAISQAINERSGYTTQVEGTTVVINGTISGGTIVADATGEFTAGQRFTSAELPIDRAWFALPSLGVASGVKDDGGPSEIQFGFGNLEDEEALEFGQRFALDANMTSAEVLGRFDSFFTGAGLSTSFSTYDVEGIEFTRLDVTLAAEDRYTWALWGSTDTGLAWGGGYSNVPEPASLSLLVGGILIYGRRR